MSAIAYLTDQKLNLKYIWKNQKVQSQLEEIIEREVVKVNDFLEQDNSRSFTKNSKCWEELKAMIEGTCIPASLSTTEVDETEDYNEEEKNIIAIANAITINWWQAMLNWAKTENRLSLIERKQASNYIKRIENNRFIKIVRQAEGAIALNDDSAVSVPSVAV